MADPLINLATQATLNGQLHFDDDAWTPRWWARTRIVLKHLERAQELQIGQAKLMAMAVTVQLGNDRQQVAQVQDLLQRIIKQVKPAGRRKGDVLDLAARWYIINVPDRLRALGVRFGQLTTVFEQAAHTGPAGSTAGSDTVAGGHAAGSATTY